jgi:hypothetical protein
MTTTLAVFWISKVCDYLSIAFREKLMITVAKHVIILVIMRSMATPYAGPHKLFKSFLKIPRSIFKKKKNVIFLVLGKLLKRRIPWWSACGSVSPTPTLKTVSSLYTSCL